MSINYNKPPMPGHQAENSELDLLPGHQKTFSFSETFYHLPAPEPEPLELDDHPNRCKLDIAPSASFKLHYLGECKQNIPPHTQEMETNILKNKYPDDVDILYEILTKITHKQCPDAANLFSEVDHLSEREKGYYRVNCNPTVLNPYIYIYLYIYIYILAHKQNANNVII